LLVLFSPFLDSSILRSPRDYAQLLCSSVSWLDNLFCPFHVLRFASAGNSFYAAAFFRVFSGSLWPGLADSPPSFENFPLDNPTPFFFLCYGNLWFFPATRFPFCDLSSSLSFRISFILTGFRLPPLPFHFLMSLCVSYQGESCIPRSDRGLWQTLRDLPEVCSFSE